jgi:hypothetical protein
MTSYVRFFHIETHHWSFLGIETLVTVMMLLLFTLLPVRYLAFFPNRGFRRFAQKRGRACVLIFLLSCLGRLALLPIEPFRAPNIHDEFSYLLASDTFAHGRLTNPTPPQWRHFEAFYVLMQPTFTSKYGAAQPLFMALGQRLLGTPRAGDFVEHGTGGGHFVLDATGLPASGMGTSGWTVSSRSHQLVQLFRQ